MRSWSDTFRRRSDARKAVIARELFWEKHDHAPEDNAAERFADYLNNAVSHADDWGNVHLILSNGLELGPILTVDNCYETGAGEHHMVSVGTGENWNYAVSMAHIVAIAYR